MNNEILVAASGTITIDTEEYRRLVEHSAYLNMILAVAHDAKTYILSDIACAVGNLVKDDMVFIKGPESAGEGVPAVEAHNEEVAHAE